MTFELDADGVRLWCSSPKWTRKLVERGARLVNPAQAAYLTDGDTTATAPRQASRRKRHPASSARKVPRER
jgi:hypothetical protein